MRRTGPAGALVIALVATLLSLGSVASAAPVEVQFGTGSARVTFARTIEFSQAVTLPPTPIRRVELLIHLEGDAGPRVRQVRGAGTLESGTLEHTFDLIDDHIYPNTDVIARFRITSEDGATTLGPEITLTYLDDRFEWRTADAQTPSGSTVRVHWYDGNAAFGARALEIARAGIAKSEARLRVTERDPIDFYIYGNDTDFYGALGPGTRENVGGVALSEIRTLFAQIRPGEIDDSWVEIVIPHELAHLVFHTAIDNPYHDPPRWLNEGLATYESEGYNGGDRLRVAEAVDNGTLIPLVGLSGLFPTTYEQFALAYAESVSAVDFMVRKHGPDALVRLVRSYADGITDDEAFEAALGMTVAEFDAAWQRDLEVVTPTQYGPQPPPPGPLPTGWSRQPEGAPAPTATPVATSVPTPAPTVAATASATTPSATAAPQATTAAPASTAASSAPTPAATRAPTPTAAAPAPIPTGGGFDNRTLGFVLGGIAIVLAVVGIGLIVNSRRTPARR